MLAPETRGVPCRGCSEEKRDRYGETENNAALTRSLDRKRRCGNRLFYATVGVRLRDPGLARDQTRQILPVIGFHSRSTGCGKQDATGLRSAVGKIALLPSLRPKQAIEIIRNQRFSWVRYGRCWRRNRLRTNRAGNDGCNQAG
jgi:hypothetical protein